MRAQLKAIADRHLFLTHADVFDAMREAYNAGLDAAAGECRKEGNAEDFYACASSYECCARRILALKGKR